MSASEFKTSLALQGAGLKWECTLVAKKSQVNPVRHSGQGACAGARIELESLPRDKMNEGGMLWLKGLLLTQRDCLHQLRAGCAQEGGAGFEYRLRALAAPTSGGG